MGKILLPLMVVLVSGCPSTAGHGLTPVWQQREYTLNTKQACLKDGVVLPLSDLALIILGQEAIKGGYDYETIPRLLSRPGVCLIQRPEPCCIGSYCQKDSNGAVTDKAGCAGEGWAWVSLEWPAGTIRDWRLDLLHEISHVLAMALGADQKPNHDVPWAEVEKRAATSFKAVLGIP